jgi:hypothetical protein
MGLQEVTITNGQRERFKLIKKFFHIDDEFENVLKETGNAIAGGSILWTLSGFKSEVENNLYAGDLDIFIDFTHIENTVKWLKRFEIPVKKCFEVEKHKFLKNSTKNSINLFSHLLEKVGYKKKSKKDNKFEKLKYENLKRTSMLKFAEYELETCYSMPKKQIEGDIGFDEIGCFENINFTRKVQLIFVSDIRDTVFNFDLSFCRCMYNGEFHIDDYYTKKLEYDNTTDYIKVVDPKKIFQGWLHPIYDIKIKITDRLDKYRQRGFSVSFIDKKHIKLLLNLDEDFFCKDVAGVILEYLDFGENNGYLLNRYNHGMRNNIEQKYLDYIN